jgi:NAD(P)-dependent dehydrogenase (short-subunit alcohol dehydrogenase family)
MTDPLASFRLDGRVAVVTGASSGMGVTFVHTLAGAGAKVVLAARRIERLEALAKEIADAGGEALAVACDVSQEADIDALVAATIDRFGKADVLVNNAGFSQILPAEHLAIADWRAQIDVNLTGVFLCAQRFGRKMLEQRRGVIVNVASILGLVGSGQVTQAAYAAAKGGVVNLTRELGAQWARKGVRVNALAPGWFPTEMTADMFSDEGAIKWMRSRAPMGRAGDVAELAGPLLFLASDASSYMTGQTIAIDGGWTAI